MNSSVDRLRLFGTLVRLLMELAMAEGVEDKPAEVRYDGLGVDEAPA